MKTDFLRKNDSFEDSKWSSLHSLSFSIGRLPLEGEHIDENHQKELDRLKKDDLPIWMPRAKEQHAS